MTDSPSPSSPVSPPPRSPDDTDEGWGEPYDDADESLRRLREDRPPHYDRG